MGDILPKPLDVSIAHLFKECSEKDERINKLEADIAASKALSKFFNAETRRLGKHVFNLEEEKN